MTNEGKMSMTETSVKERQPNIALITNGKLSWVYIEKPTKAEADYLAQHYPSHPLNLDDILSRIQRPKIDEYEDHLFLVLHFPVFDKQTRMITPSEVDIFIGEDFLVTVHCSGDLKPLTTFFQQCQSDEKNRQIYMGQGSGFLLYHILDRLTDYCFPILNKITENIEAVENVIFAKTTINTVRRISFIRRDLISLRSVVHPQIIVIETLERKEYPFFKEGREIYFGDIADHYRKVWDGLQDAKEVIDSLTDTSNWLTSHNIQEVMRVLTIFMAIVMPVEVVASIEGSNLIPESWLHNPTLFHLSFAVQAVIVIAMLIFLRRRRWI
jgi:magnesium transporter